MPGRGRTALRLSVRLPAVHAVHRSLPAGTEDIATGGLFAAEASAGRFASGPSRACTAASRALRGPLRAGDSSDRTVHRPGQSGLLRENAPPDGKTDAPVYPVQSRF